MPTRILPSRKLQLTVAIPWAIAVAPVAEQPLPAYEAPVQLQQKRTDRRLLVPPGLDQYAVTPVAAEPLPAYEVPIQLQQKRTGRRLLVPAGLNRYQVTPTYPAYLEPLGFMQRKTARHVIAVAPVIIAVPVVPEQPPTAYQIPDQFKRRGFTVRQELPELNFYPQPVISPAVLPALTPTGFIERRGTVYALLDITPIPSPGVFVVDPTQVVISSATVQVRLTTEGSNYPELLTDPANYPRIE